MRIICGTVPVIIFLLLSFSAIAADVPKFFGVYAFNNGEYTEIPRVETTTQVKDHYAILRATTTHLVPKKSFVEISTDNFNKKGFIIVGEDIANEVIKYPKIDGRFIGNRFQKSASIYTDFIEEKYKHKGQGAGMNDGPKLRKAKIAENTYAYLPRAPLSPGYYVIDYTTLGKQPQGNWNVIKLVGGAGPEMNAEEIPLVSVFNDSQWQADTEEDKNPPYTIYLREGGQIDFWSKKRKKVIRKPGNEWRIDRENLVLSWANGTSETFDVSTSQFDQYFGQGHNGKKWVITRRGL